MSSGPKAFDKVTIKGSVSPIFIITAELMAPVIIVPLFNESVFAELGAVYFRVKIIIRIHIIDWALANVAVAIVSPFLPFS